MNSGKPPAGDALFNERSANRIVKGPFSGCLRNGRRRAASGRWPTLLPTSSGPDISFHSGTLNYIHIRLMTRVVVLRMDLVGNFDLWRGSTLSPIRSHWALRLRPHPAGDKGLAVRPYPARTCRTGPRRRCRNNLSDCGPSRSCTRHRGYFPMRPVPTEDPAP
mgnify:CR=1 FL=1